MKSVKIENKFQDASLWKRFSAYVLDLLLINFIVSIPFANYFGSKVGSVSDLLFGSRTDSGFFLVSFLIIVLVLFYFVIMDYKIGQTIGMMIFGIYSISLVGKRIGFGQAFTRNLLTPFPIVLLVDSFYMFFKGGRRRLFETFSITASVERRIAAG